MTDTITAPYLIPVRESGVPGFGLQGRCPLCDRWSSIRDIHDRCKPGTLSIHTTENGGLCRGVGMAITLEAALARDSQPNAEEAMVRSHVFRHLTGCRGPLIHTECHHPACHQAVRKGLRWTLMGWQKTPDPALF